MIADFDRRCRQPGEPSDAEENRRAPISGVVRIDCLGLELSRGGDEFIIEDVIGFEAIACKRLEIDQGDFGQPLCDWLRRDETGRAARIFRRVEAGALGDFQNLGSGRECDALFAGDQLADRNVIDLGQQDRRPFTQV